MRATVQLKGEARQGYGKIYQLFENEKLSVTLRRTGWDSKYEGIKPENWTTEDIVMFIDVVAGEKTDLNAEVESAINEVNRIYPGCAIRVNPRV
jgi:hypothetical protein